MAFSIEQLKSEISAGGGMAIGNLYHVQLPTFTAQNLDVEMPSMSLLCRAATIPGRQILSTEKQIGVYTTKMAYGFAAEDVTLTFYALNDFEVRKYFEEWQAAAVNHTTGTVGYFDEYTAPVVIHHLKKEVAFPVIRKKLFCKGRSVRLFCPLVGQPDSVERLCYRCGDPRLNIDLGKILYFGK